MHGMAWRDVVVAARRMAGPIVAAVALCAAPAALAAKDYPDATGDQGSGTDIANINVGNDASGLITFRITTGTPLLENHALLMLIDADKNSATGDPRSGFGYDVAMMATPNASVFLSWNGSDLARSSPASLRTARTGQTFEFAISRADMGNTSGFRFVVLSGSFDNQEPQVWDASPDGATHTYDLEFFQCANGADDDGDGRIDTADPGCSGPTDGNEADDPVTIRLAKPKPAVVPVKAGELVTVTAGTTRVETAQPLDSGTVRCRATVSGSTAAMRGSGTVVDGRAQCRFRVSRASTGKFVRGEMTVVYRGATATSPFAIRVAR